MPTDPLWEDVPFAEAIDDLAARMPVLANVVAEARGRYDPAHLFWMSRAATTQITERVHKALGDALEEGVDFEGFVDAVEYVAPEVAGWSKSYLELVFRNANAHAYARGREAQAERLGDFVIGWEYSAVGDNDTRDNHQAASGVIVPVSRTDVLERMRVPRGHRCRCGLRMVTRPEAAKRGMLEELEAGMIRWPDGSWHDDIPTAAEPKPEELVFTGAA